MDNLSVSIRLTIPTQNCAGDQPNVYIRRPASRYAREICGEPFSATRGRQSVGLLDVPLELAAIIGTFMHSARGRKLCNEASR